MEEKYQTELLSISSSTYAITFNTIPVFISSEVLRFFTSIVMKQNRVLEFSRKLSVTCFTNTKLIDLENAEVQLILGSKRFVYFFQLKNLFYKTRIDDVTTFVNFYTEVFNLIYHDFPCKTYLIFQLLLQKENSYPRGCVFFCRTFCYFKDFTQQMLISALYQVNRITL